MRTSTLLHIAAVCVAVQLLPAYAQAPAKNVAPPPPKLEKMEEGEQPAITIAPPDSGTKITEKRQQGKVTEVKVKSGKSTYYLKPNEPAGSAAPGDVQSNQIRAAEWPILEFDLGRKKTNPKEAEPPQTLQPAGAQPTASAPKK
ncbi:DUF2782 domain-containing protein [Undibacterium arcticum]|uniref:DUF2782 domain-containing protein n=1 Tax=Undibacterium arcticum TaxID=1762892 RepID=A0ABV7F8A5_9BURK